MLHQKSSWRWHGTERPKAIRLSDRDEERVMERERAAKKREKEKKESADSEGRYIGFEEIEMIIRGWGYKKKPGKKAKEAAVDVAICGNLASEEL